MSKSTRSAGLDPRLEKLVNRGPDPMDERSGLVARDTAAQTLQTRVLVQLSTHVIPPSIAKYRPVPVGGDVYAMTVPVADLDALGKDPDVLYVEAPRRMRSTLESSVPETRADRVHRAPLSLRGAGVVVGIIDFGFDVRLDDFRDPAGKSRIACFWDQSLSPTGNEASPQPFGYGVEYSQADIDKELAAAVRGSVVRHQFDPASHGTHVAGTAAGNGRSHDAAFPIDRFVGAAPEATLIVVQPETLPSDPTFADSVRVAEAVAYVFEKARQLRLPCVINMSLGQNGGSHDGESVVERAIDALLTTPGRAFVCAAGNEHVWRGHSGGSISAAASKTLKWRVGGNMPLAGNTTGSGPDVTANELEIWYSHLDSLRATVRSVSGDVAGPVSPGESLSVDLPSGNRVTISSERFSRLNGDAQIYVELSPGSLGRVESGTWQVILDPIEIRVGRYDAWIERDIRRSGNNFADQSFFVDGDFEPRMTLGTPATTRRGVAVANYDHRNNVPAGSSSRGPTRDLRQKPEIAAPGTGIVASCSGAGQPLPNGSAVPARTTMSGTSMAAPHVSGVVALLLQRNPRLTAAQISSILRASARDHPNGRSFDDAWGFGPIDAEAALARVPVP